MGSSAFPHSLLPSPSLPRLSSIASFPFPTCLKFSSNTCNRARAFSFHDNSPDPELPEGDSSPELPQDGAPRKPKKPKKEKLPNGLRRYQTMAILRPDITEDERIDWTQRYEEVQCYDTLLVLKKRLDVVLLLRKTLLSLQEEQLVWSFSIVA